MNPTNKYARMAEAWKEQNRLVENIHTAAVDAVVRFLSAQNPKTAKAAIKKYLEQ